MQTPGKPQLETTMPQKNALEAEAEQQATSKARFRYLLRNPILEEELIWP